MSSVLEFAPTPSMTDAVRELEVAVEGAASIVAAGCLEGVSASELLDLTTRLQAIASRAQALVVSAVAEVRDAEVARTRGFASTARWLEVDAGLSRGQSRGVVGLGERLQWDYPATRDAWLAGDIGEGAVREITSLVPQKLKGLPEAEYVARRTELEAMALDVARTRSVPEVRRAIQRAAFVANPVGAEAAVIAARDSQFLRFTPVTDGVEVRGFLSVGSAAVVLTAFDQCHDALYRSGELSQDTRRDGLGATRGMRAMRREHHNAEILADLASRLLDDGALGTKHAQRPHLTVTVHADDYAAGLGGEVLLPGFGSVLVPNATIDRLRCDAEVHPVLTRPTGRSRESDRLPGCVRRTSDPPWRPTWGGVGDEVGFGRQPLSQEIEADTDVAALAEFGEELDDADSWWNRFFGEPTRHVLDVGRSFRSAPPKLRRALAVRDGGCAAPGCDVDASRCEAHHIVYWEHHGETSISNMILLCSKHHHMVHEGGWRIEIDLDAEPGHPDYIRLVRGADLRATEPHYAVA